MKNLGRRSLSSILSIFLNIIWWAEWLFAACSIVVAVVLLFRKEDLSFNAPIHFSPVNFRTISSSAFGLPAGRVDISQGLIYLPLKCNPQNIAVALGILLAFLAFCILITYQLRKIFASFSQNEPFVATNARRIRNIGVLIIGYSGIRYLFDAALTAFLQSHFTGMTGLRLTYHFDIATLLAGIILIIIAEIFTTGTAIENELKLTI